MTNPSTIWTQLASPLQAAWSVPFVSSDNYTIITDVLNFSYNGSTHQLTLGYPPQFGYVSNTTPGATAICNAPSGRVQLSAGQGSIVVTNSFVTANSIINVVVESADATALWLKTVTPGAGTFTIAMNANSSGVTKLAFVVVNQ